jgi:hypothetical protein
MRHAAGLRSTLRRAALIGLVGLAACRAVLGIEDRPLLPDESVLDAGAADVIDAGPDTSRFCEGVTPPPTFCTDFDFGGDGDLLSEWAPTTTSGTNPHLLSGGTATPDPAQFRSGPRSARFAVPTLTGANGTATAFAAVDLPPDVTFLFLETEVRIDTELFTPDAGGDVVLFEIDLPGSGAIRVARDDRGLRLVVADYLLGTEASAPFDVMLPIGEWVTLKVLFHNDVATEGNEVTAFLGSPVAHLATPGSFQRKLGKAPILRAGIVSAKSPVGVFRVNFDNLVVSYAP